MLHIQRYLRGKRLLVGPGIQEGKELDSRKGFGPGTRKGRHYTSLAPLTLAGLLTLLLLLAACGHNPSNGGSSSSPTATATVSLQVTNCGNLHSLRNLIVPTDQNFAKPDEDCFWRAYSSQCHPATLSYAVTAVDMGMIHNFSLKSVNGTCTITDKVQHFIAPNPPSTLATYTCSSMTEQSDGLHIYSCGQAGNIFIPLASSE